MTPYDPDEPDDPTPTKGTAIPFVRPDVQNIARDIEKRVDALLEAIEAGHKRWLRGDLNEAEKQRLREAADYIQERIGRPPSGVP